MSLYMWAFMFFSKQNAFKQALRCVESIPITWQPSSLKPFWIRLFVLLLLLMVFPLKHHFLCTDSCCS